MNEFVCHINRYSPKNVQKVLKPLKLKFHRWFSASQFRCQKLNPRPLKGQ